MVRACVQYRVDRLDVRQKFVAPLQQIAESMSLAAQSKHSSTTMVPYKSKIFEISNIQRSFIKLHASLKSFSRYVPEQYINNRLQHCDDVGVSIEDGHGTVLFSDIASFTTISESLEPQRLHQVTL